MYKKESSERSNLRHLWGSAELSISWHAFAKLYQTMLKGIHVVNLRLCIPYSGCALPLNVRAIMALHMTSPEQHK